MTRYRVRDLSVLRGRMAKSKRIVPHALRSLAEQVEVSQALIGHLLTGKRETVDESLAARISSVLGCSLDALFVRVPARSDYQREERTDATTSTGTGPSYRWQPSIGCVPCG